MTTFSSGIRSSVVRSNTSRSIERAAVVPVLVGNDLDLFFDHAKEQVLIRKNCPVLLNASSSAPCTLPPASRAPDRSACADAYQRLPVPVHHLEPKRSISPAFAACVFADPRMMLDHFINIIKGDQQSLQNMCPLLGLVQIVFGSSGDNILLMVGCSTSAFL